MSQLLSAGLVIVALGFLYLIWALNGLALAMYFVSFGITAAAIGLPWYFLDKRRERQMLREMHEAATKGASAPRKSN